MLNARMRTSLLTPMFLLAAVATLAPAAAQDFAPHRAVYAVSSLTAASRAPARPAPMPTSCVSNCDGGYVVNQRLRLETAGARAAVASEQQSQMTESRDGRSCALEHRTTTGGRQTSWSRARR